KLSDIQIETDGRFRQWYLLDRLEPEKEAALNVTSLERRLQLFKLDPRIQNIQASLLPGEKLGTAVLKARVEESNPISV
ncbi:MAG: ShlB/FhaC/HecB family hemolysin secretion/activation protein, partial [Nitrospinaceae bacterium]|nr:ShlB/FhaC/HecB family hemolysin secretion/activation protein [Nitrospinaceae bacterium]NIR53464.1 ShlB/FhaC/HecB family hemolysin secretion/activation protein [Nitrospinaceae bacterium]NIT80660.1 ShlB/FhaC/HecB family hemolysin secretion/activation protein [Nitrospinaceae bacterium]NIX33064.1 ShlB/FhaC/HecB family hemolysin secretion/activation protein [Nitrospinaceae bacterium]NIY13684.1 ShlB/FhaC/HecB family hemolysin secretion/activation protein [Nitrospinaceae bacterium]